MSKRYPGNFITGNPVALSQTSNAGVWDLKDQYQAQNNGTWQEVDGIYEIPRSLRFRRSALPYLGRTFSTAGNAYIGTHSFWTKKSSIDAIAGTGNMYLGWTNNSNRTHQVSSSDDCFTLYVYNNDGGGSGGYSVSTVAKYRDPSAWYHVVMAFDSTQSVEKNRVKIYVNGVQQPLTGTYPVQNMNMWISQAVEYRLGVANTNGSNGSTDGYVADQYYIDGQQLDPSYFGYFDSITNIWQPKKYTGAYGVNGFYLPFREPVATSGTVNAFNLGRNFAGGTNYIRYSEDGSQTSYGYTYNNATNTVNNTVAPDGTTTGNKLTADGVSGVTHRFYCGCVTTPAGSTQTASIYLKYNNCQYVNIENWNGSNYQTQTFDILNGVPMVGGSAVTAVGFTSQFVGNGWYRVSVPLYAGSAATGGPSIAVYLCDASGNVTWNGNSTSAVYWWGAQINLGTTADPYFRTASSTTITNDWTPTNFSLTAGSSYDSMVDSPTNVFTSVTDTGGVVTGNYCTLNAADKAINNILLDGNLVTYYYPYANSNNSAPVRGTIGVNGGKWYIECFAGVNSGSGNSALVGFTTSNGKNHLSSATMWGNGINFIGVDVSVYNNKLYLRTNGFSSSVADSTQLFATYAAADICSLAIDLDAGKIWVGKNGSWHSGNPSTDTSPTATFTPPTTTVFTQFEPITSGDNGNRSALTTNFGQRPFAYAPPTGFKTINTTNLQALGAANVGKAAIQPHKWFDTTLYGGTGGTLSVKTKSGFAPDLAWLKMRNSAGDHYIWDTVRGNGSSSNIITNRVNVEGYNSAYHNFAFNQDGFDITQNSSGNEVNYPGNSYVSWMWKQSPTAGFNIVSYTGNGTNNRAISHNLGVAPAFIIVKDLSVGYNWDIYHKDLGIGATLIFTSAATRNNSAFGSTAPTSSNFYTQNDYTNTNNSRLVAYLWADVPGFSKFGSYTGNGSTDGPFINTGFCPKYILLKHSSGINSWWVYDSVRSSYNLTYSTVHPSDSDAEENSTSYGIDLLSNGFKIKNSDTRMNTSGGTYIYAAFAESPFGLNNRAR